MLTPLWRGSASIGPTAYCTFPGPRNRLAAGYSILKIKVGTPRDAEILRMIRDEAPEKTLRVDANTGKVLDVKIQR